MKKILFLILFLSSFDTLAAVYWNYPDRCAPSNETQVSTTSKAMSCSVIENVSGYGLTGDCIEGSQTYDSVNKYYKHYACPQGADWGAYDTDNDGVSNSSDSAPFDPAVNSALTPQEQCIADGNYWYNDQCNTEPETPVDPDPTPAPDPTPTDPSDPIYDVGGYTCEGETPPVSFWATNYQNGITGLWDSQKAAFDNQPVLDVLNLSLPSSGTNNGFQFCFNMGSGMNYGCQEIKVDDYVWAFIRLCVIITAAWTCRGLIFGG